MSSFIPYAFGKDTPLRLTQATGRHGTEPCPRTIGAGRYDRRAEPGILPR